MHSGARDIIFKALKLEAKDIISKALQLETNYLISTHSL